MEVSFGKALRGFTHYSKLPTQLYTMVRRALPPSRVYMLAWDRLRVCQNGLSMEMSAEALVAIRKCQSKYELHQHIDHPYLHLAT